MTEILLLNGFTPLRRSPADVFLDNGIGLLRAALRRAGIDFEIEDPCTLNEIRAFDNPEVTLPLRELLEAKLFSERELTASEQANLENLYASMLASHQKHMESYLGRLVDRVSRERIPIVGIKLWAGSAFTYSKSLCEQIHAHSPETVVVVGGPQVNCYSYNGQILKLAPFDIAVYSEGEHALVRIVETCRVTATKAERLAALAEAFIPGTIFRSGDKVVVAPAEAMNVNQKEIPEYADMAGRVPVHTVIDALGCDYAKCSFCIHPKIYPRFRKRTAHQLVDEMEHMVGQGIGLFSFTASDTPLPHAVRISEEILRRGLKVEYTMLTRAKRNACQHVEQLVSRFRTLIQAGLKSVFFGVESANDGVLRHVMNKGVTADDIAVTMECLRKAAEAEDAWVNIIASFIFPVPIPKPLLDRGTTQDSLMEDNLKLLQRIPPDSFHAVPGLLYPGTRWYTHPEEFGIRFKEEHFLQRWISQEFSYHVFMASQREPLYSFAGLEFSEMIPLSLEFARRGNALGIPSDLWDEHFMFARASGVKGAEALKKLSQDLFLDLLTCDDRHTRYLYHNTCRHSQSVARSNVALFTGAPLLRDAQPRRSSILARSHQRSFSNRCSRHIGRSEPSPGEPSLMDQPTGRSPFKKD